MNEEVDVIHAIKNALLKLFPEAIPGNNGNIKSFSSFGKEYHALTKGVGVRSLSGNVILKLTGKDVPDFLHRVSTNDVKNLGVFKHKNTLFTNEKGRIIDRTTLLKIGDYFLLVGNPDSDEKLKNWIEKYIIMEDIVLADVSQENTIFEFYGSQVDSFFTMLCGDKLADLNGENITVGDTESIKSYVTKLKDINSVEKYWVIVSSAEAISFINYLNENRSVFDLQFAGDTSFEYFRIQNGMLSPNEINIKYNPHEINLISEVSFTKGCYIGQEVIARLDTYDKVQRTLKGVILDIKSIPELPIQLTSEDGSDAGEITSLAKSELNGEIIGLALVRKKAIENSGVIFANLNEKDQVKVQLTDLPIEE